MSFIPPIAKMELQGTVPANTGMTDGGNLFLFEANEIDHKGGLTSVDNRGRLAEYVCMRRDANGLPGPDDPVWNGLPEIQLVDTVTGLPGRLHTSVRAFWNDEGLCIRFDCEDDYRVATMRNRDDPIYEEDVVEFFVSETGNLSEYKEFEVSPMNVQFDALIENELKGKISVHTEWDAEGWITQTDYSGNGPDWYSLWLLPFDVFSRQPAQGDVWPANFYRIDRSQVKGDMYVAWSPTGKANFHHPERFGHLRFDGS